MTDREGTPSLPDTARWLLAACAAVCVSTFPGDGWLWNAARLEEDGLWRPGPALVAEGVAAVVGFALAGSRSSNLAITGAVAVALAVVHTLGVLSLDFRSGDAGLWVLVLLVAGVIGAGVRGAAGALALQVAASTWEDVGRHPAPVARAATWAATAALVHGLVKGPLHGPTVVGAVVAAGALVAALGSGERSGSSRLRAVALSSLALLVAGGSEAAWWIHDGAEAAVLSCMESDRDEGAYRVAATREPGVSAAWTRYTATDHGDRRVIEVNLVPKETGPTPEELERIRSNLEELECRAFGPLRGWPEVSVAEPVPIDLVARVTPNAGADPEGARAEVRAATRAAFERSALRTGGSGTWDRVPKVVLPRTTPSASVRWSVGPATDPGVLSQGDPVLGFEQGARFPVLGELVVE